MPLSQVIPEQHRELRELGLRPTRQANGAPGLHAAISESDPTRPLPPRHGQPR